MEFDLQQCRYLLEQHNALLLDIRTVGEFCGGHFDGAALIPTALPPLNACQERNLTLLLNRAIGPCENRVIVVYCKKGIRASKARDLIINKLGGNPDLIAVAGGTIEEPLKSLIQRGEPLYYDIGCNGERNVPRLFISE